MSLVNVDCGAIGQLVDRVLDRAADHPRWYIAVWSALILATTVTAVVCHAPWIVYVIVLIVTVLVFAGGRRRQRS